MLGLVLDVESSIDESGKGSRLGGRFQDALLTTDDVSIIAEIKRRSPSRGDLNVELDPAELAIVYRNGGAACLSVLTNENMFGGCSDDLTAAAEASELPVLRKDFITTVDDVHESQRMGADALLLIVADLSETDLAELHELALSLDMDVLTEVKSEDELKIALDIGAYMIGVNQRDQPKSPTFTLEYDRAERMAGQIPDHVIKVAASGIEVPKGPRVADLQKFGYDAALIGEALVTAEDPEVRLQQMLASQFIPA